MSIRFRLFIAGEMVTENWATNGAEGILAGAEHDRHIRAAAGAGWMIEIYNPDALPDRAYIRCGTDPSMMVDPNADVGLTDDIETTVMEVAAENWGLPL